MDRQRPVDLERTLNALKAEYPVLCWRLNPGEHYRVMRPDIRRGSVWIIPRLDHWCVNPTGAVWRRLEAFLKGQFGTVSHWDKPKSRWPYWDVTDLKHVATIVREFGRL
jgi:hypothetical protein